MTARNEKDLVILKLNDNILPEYEKIKSKNTLIIIKLVALTIENGMKILGVNLPTKM